MRVGLEPYGLATSVVSGVTYIYVANTGSDNVSVINTSTNTVVATVPVGVKPYYVAALGSSIYVTNSLSNTVSAISTATNSVTATIPVGTYPRGIKAQGTDIYVANYGDENYSGGNSISVINSLTNTVSTTIISPGGSDGPRGVNVLGTKVYVANFRSNNVSVIDTATKAITNTITVGRGPRGVLGLGSKVYIENFDDGTISVIDTGTNTVTATVQVGHSPAGMAVSGTDIYITRFQDNTVGILSSVTNTLRPLPTVIAGLSVVPSRYSASVNWETDRPANSLVEYGTTSDYGLTQSDAAFVTNHALTLSDLQPATLYHYRITSVDNTGNTTISSDRTFTTSGSGVGVIGGTEPGVVVGPVPSPDMPLTFPTATIPPSPEPETTEIPSNNNNTSSPSALQNIKSKIFIAVEDRGKLWYENPNDGLRYEITVPSALDLFKKVSLGISNANLNKVPESGSQEKPSSLADRLKNLFLLQVENRGQTWYVDASGYRHFVTAASIIDMSRSVMVGILNKELNKISVGSTK